MAKSNKIWWLVGIVGLSIYGSFLEENQEVKVTSKTEIKTLTKIDNSQHQSGARLGKICKSGIAALMFQDPMNMRSSALSNNVQKISYVRSNDSKAFSYKCKVNGNKIIWGAIDGRWRDGSYDDTIIFKINQNTISITQKYLDGSINKNNYDLSIM